MPSIPDSFVIPALENPTELEVYQTHCWPEIESIASRIGKVREDWRRATGDELNHLYILTNGSPGWVDDLKFTLRAGKHIGVAWEGTIMTSQDLHLSNEQNYVAQAIDMAIAERATVFIGNGVCSLILHFWYPTDAFKLVFILDIQCDSFASYAQLTFIQ